MDFLDIVNVVLGCINLLILIGVAGTTSKVLQYLATRHGTDDEVMPSRNEHLLDLPTGQIYRDERGQLVETGRATYADPNVLSGRGEPHADGVTERPSSTNWDGVPQHENDNE